MDRVGKSSEARINGTDLPVLPPKEEARIARVSLLTSPLTNVKIQAGPPLFASRLAMLPLFPGERLIRCRACYSVPRLLSPVWCSEAGQTRKILRRAARRARFNMPVIF